ncbi:hypothetical protein Taro_032967 [Colocasia esculenta]|uniref:SUN domain-containing protein n=1 Tax=Colocasia esculenta TaxID=4460 RepID=A0A843W5G9_COLES|nr:hypothetical protein [Colocasia esculenta]
MSASTVAITANPTANNAHLVLDPDPKRWTRRRQVAVAENKSTAGVVVVGRYSGSSGDEVVHEKNPGCSRRGDAVLQGPEELSPPKKSPIEAATVPSRRKKSTLNPENPGWPTVFCILFLLVTVVLWLGWFIWRYGDDLFKSSKIPLSAMPFSVADLEGRISDAEASMRATERMMQDELQNLDTQLVSEIDNLRGGLMDQIKEKNEIFSKGLEKLERKVDSLGSSLADIRDSSFFIQEELGGLSKDGQSSEKEGTGWSLDEIRIHARDVVLREIERHAADGLGKVDYALASGGARVVWHSEPYDLGMSSWIPMGKGRNGIHTNAHKMLEPSFGEPGQCFPLRGNTGFVEIQLRTAIILDSVTLEHVAKSVAYDRSSAPRDCRISAWFEPPGGAGDDDRSTGIKRMPPVMEFTYDLEKSNAQTFNMVMAGTGVINMVRFDFSSNHGSSSHTCIYRLRVHGHDPKSLVTMAVQA